MCMLNCKKSFPIPNVPVDLKLVRFNVLFAYIFDAVSGAKGMLNYKIDPSKHQTIHNLLHETFPTIKSHDYAELYVLNPNLVAYIHALVIDCISIAFSDSVNSRALEHEATMLDVYSKMTRDAFSSQLQTVLTDYYEDIKGIVCASGCTKSKVVKRKFEDHDDIPADAPAPAPAPAPAADNAADNAADPPPTSPTDGGASSAGGEEPAPPATSPAGKVGRGAKAGGAGKKGGKPQG